MEAAPEIAPENTPESSGRDMKAEARGVLQSLRRLFDQLGPTRLGFTGLFLILAMLVARLSWHTPLVQEAERALYDLRTAVFAPEVAKDDRIVMVVYNEDTLRLTGQRSPVDRTILAEALRVIDAAGAKAIGIDILFDMPQDDDPLLLESFEAMQTPTYLAYADPKYNPEITFEQHEYLVGFLENLTNTKVAPTSIDLFQDSDGVQRRWNPLPVDLPPFLAIAMTGANQAFTSFDGAVRYHVPESADVPVFDKFPIETFADPEMAEFVAPMLAGKYVLIGGDFIDRDRFDTPVTAIKGAVGPDGKMIGLEAHAHMLAQLLNNDIPASIPNWILWAAAITIALCGGLSALVVGNAGKVALVLLAQAAAIFALPFLLHNWNFDTHELPAFGWALGWGLGYASVGSAARTINSKQRAFAQSALGKYLPKSIAGEILRDPDKLALHGEKRKIFAVFTDLEGFTKLSHAVEPEMVATLLNDYLDRLSEVALEYGGTIDKFVGDALVAFWGAPIAYPDDGERAAKAAYALYQAGEEFRRNVPEGVPPIGRTRVGMHYGDAIVGNFGGEGRIQYTALGDAMNTAARLEAANKALHTKVLISREAMVRTGLDWYRPMGRITLRGRSTPVDVYEPVPQWEKTERSAVTAVIAGHEKGDIKALSALKTLTKTMAAKYDKGGDIDDLALENLLIRLEQTKQGESYALG